MSMLTHTLAVANKDKLSNERQLSEYSMYLQLQYPNRLEVQADMGLGLTFRR